MDDRTYHELYLWPFARSVEAGVTAVMCAYNKGINELMENTKASLWSILSSFV